MGDYPDDGGGTAYLWGSIPRPYSCGGFWWAPPGGYNPYDEVVEDPWTLLRGGSLGQNTLEKFLEDEGYEAQFETEDVDD